jgi:DNA-binding NarL/FixJ family response regulator
VEVVGIARDGVQAVELAALLEPDVVLLDIDMPRLDGFQAAERIREQSPDIRIVIITGEARSGNGTRARELGTSGYVLKAAVDEELLPAIHAEAAA